MRTLRAVSLKPPPGLRMGRYDLDAVVIERDDGVLDFRFELGELGDGITLTAVPTEKGCACRSTRVQRLARAERRRARNFAITRGGPTRALRPRDAPFLRRT